MAKLLAASPATMMLGEGPLPLANEEARAADSPSPNVAERARALVVEHFDFVWRLLRRLGLPEADCDDAAQQVFVVAAGRLGNIPEGSERSFVFGTALRTAATLRRNQRRRRRWIETRPADCAADGDLPDELLERRQALALLDEILGELSDELRVVFVLCELEELNAAEVSVLLGIPIGTVASRLRRARQEFTKCVRRSRARRLKEAR
jgi:RNA polymerase sigma-70 factor, ECF subfamily